MARRAGEISVKFARNVDARRCGILKLALDSGNRTAWTVAVLVMLALSMGGCATSIADLPLVGVPSDAPARPKDPAAYPAVEDLPAPREQGAMDVAEQAKIAKELIAARDRQATVVAPNHQAAVGPKAVAPKAVTTKAKAPRPSDSKPGESEQSESKPQQ
jgi:hypothetical protein